MFPLIWRGTKAAIATVTVAAPSLISEKLQHPWTKVAWLTFAALVFLGAFWQLAPDRRFLRIRVPTLNEIVGNAFHGQFGNASGDFRAHLMQPKWSAWGRVLAPSYSFQTPLVHADHGHCWRRKRGACWEAFTSGRAVYVAKTDPRWRTMGLTEKDLRATEHVHGVLALPLRKPSKGDDVVASRPVAVLCIDALTPASADLLEERFAQLGQHGNPGLIRLATAASLYC